MKRVLFIILSLCFCSLAWAWEWWPLPYFEIKDEGQKTKENKQQDSLYYTAEILGVASSGQFAPFLLQSNRNGNIAASPFSANLSAGIYKPATAPNRWFDYDFGVQLTGRIAQPFNHVASSTYTGYFNQLYAHVRLAFVDITAGIYPYSVGLQDNSLSSGSLLFSTNAQPIPRITIGFNDYVPFPGLFGYLEVKGGLTHGWFADNVQVENAYLHHKWAGARIGGSLPVRLAYEFHHAAQWGGNSTKYGDLGNTWDTYKHIFMAHSGGDLLIDQINAQGNHIGSQILSVEVEHAGWFAQAYWQTIFEDGPIFFMTHTMNRPDGLWGVQLRQEHWPFISALTYEFINTTDQSGPYHDRDGFIYGGDDRYFWHSIYPGWNYHYRTIGTPYITSPLYNSDNSWLTTNNRTQVHFIGLKGDIFGYRYRLIGSYAQNWGMYRDPKQSTNTAILLEVKKHVKRAWGIDVGLALSADFGSQFGNSLGAMFTITKRGIIHAW